jgi:uncharacterized membrane protein
MTNIQFIRGGIDAGGCVSNAWEMVKQSYGFYLGVSLVALLLTGCIPCLNLFLMGPILGGVYYVALRQMAGEPVEFGMMFRGFDKFVPLMVIGLIQSVPEVIGQVLRVGIQFGQIGLDSNRGGSYDYFQSSKPDIISGIAAGAIVIIAIVALVLILFAVVWRFLLFFAIPLAMEHDIGAMDAIKLSIKAAGANVGGIIVLFIFEFLVSLLGVLLCVVGVFLVAIPVIYVANVFAYRQVFPRLQQTINNMMPPPPNAYGFEGGGLGLG